MYTFKIEHFLATHGGAAFPEHCSLSPNEAADVRNALGHRLGLEQADGPTMLKRLNEVTTAMPHVNALAPDFNLRAVMASGGVHPKAEIYVNWHQFDNLDRMGIDDLSKYFDDIWYPSSDDIDIFDSTFAWVVSISHDGNVNLAML